MRYWAYLAAKLLAAAAALYGLLALRGGEFNLLPFTEPPRRTIEGQWESLLMEAARLHEHPKPEILQDLMRRPLVVV